MDSEFVFLFINYKLMGRKGMSLHNLIDFVIGTKVFTSMYY